MKWAPVPPGRQVRSRLAARLIHEVTLLEVAPKVAVGEVWSEIMSRFYSRGFRVCDWPTPIRKVPSDMVKVIFWDALPMWKKEALGRVLRDRRWVGLKSIVIIAEKKWRKRPEWLLLRDLRAERGYWWE